MKKFSIDEKVYDVVERIPETKQIFISLGFTHLANDAMYKTVAKVITLRKAATMHKIPMETLKTVFHENSIEIEEEEL